MICYKDRAFCASPNCLNLCGSKPPITIQEDAERWWNPKDIPEKRGKAPIAWSYYCGNPVPDDAGTQ